MKATQKLHDLGQSLCLDNITRGLLTRGTLRRYIDELSVTGLTCNPTIYDHAVKNTDFYDNAIRQKVREGKSGEDLFFELALEDLTKAADLFRPIYQHTENRAVLHIALLAIVKKSLSIVTRQGNKHETFFWRSPRQLSGGELLVKRDRRKLRKV
jgi:hypothetical protein